MAPNEWAWPGLLGCGANWEKGKTNVGGQQKEGKRPQQAAERRKGDEGRESGKQGTCRNNEQRNRTRMTDDRMKYRGNKGHTQRAGNLYEI